MNAIIILILVVTVLQLVVCKFSLWWLIAFICRMLFTLRIVGATFKVKTLAIGEAIAFASMLLWNMLFHKGNVPWGHLGLFALLSGLVCFLMFIDELFYVYIIEDDDDDTLT